MFCSNRLMYVSPVLATRGLCCSVLLLGEVNCGLSVLGFICDRTERRKTNLITRECWQDPYKNYYIIEIDTAFHYKELSCMFCPGNRSQVECFLMISAIDVGLQAVLAYSVYGLVTKRP